MTNSAAKELALDVVRQLRDAGYEALWAGGCVRDLLMGHAPTDYDVATSATPHQVREVFGRRRTLPVGISFGVMIVLSPTSRDVQIDVATFRTDATYSDGRRPDAVTFSSPREDAQRRDFTINGMFYDPLQDAVIDYVDGQVDLQRGIVRAIGHAGDRIAEDKLRMLRAIRIAARFGFSIEPETRAAIAQNAGHVAAVSGERIWMEVRKTLETERAAWGVAEWAEVGLLEHILPEVAASWPARGLATTHMLTAAWDFNWQVRFCGLLWQAVGTDLQSVAATVQSLRSRLKLANDVCNVLKFCLPAQALLMDAEHQPWSAVQPLLVHSAARYAVELFELRARTAESARDPSLEHTAQWLRQQLSRAPCQLDPPPLLDGADLVAAGLQPGPKFKQLLDEARQLQLDQTLSDRATALVWLRDNIRKQ